MSNYPRQDMQNQLLGRQLAVVFSCSVWLILAIATALGICISLYYAMLGSGMLPTTPEAAFAAKHTMISTMVLTVPGIILSVTLFFYLKKHLPPNFEEIESLSNQLRKP